ncbi:MAG: RagB/SusD family nutrient uptake outer membrane protein [Paludibacteraceae bacterium]|nr:RagB/SusD family nutrient uptake outer membrane protein [Paludibacteraceae bacterium]
MKTFNKIYAVVLVVAVAFCGCSESFLDRYPASSTLLQDQYEKLDNTLEGSMRGIYSMLYAVSDHDAFGQRSIDMYGDLLCGDMALTSETYGWFSNDEKQQVRTGRSGYVWTYYYDILRNINMVIRTVKTQTTLLDSVAVYGFPTDGMKVIDGSGNVVHQYNSEDSLHAVYYAQALTMRGYVYSGLIRFFVPTVDHLFGGAYNLTNYPAFPLYTEDNLDNGPQPLAMINQVYNLVESDFDNAIKYFETFGKDYARNTKLEVDVNVARGLAAYYYLNRAREIDVTATDPLLAIPMRKALNLAVDVIDSQNFSIIPSNAANNGVLTSGFNSVSNDSWMWGQTVTVETAGGLASFFGQVDIHSYSYAWAGDTKVIDKNLYDAIPVWDIRKRWFNDGSANSSFTLCPDKKFFSAKNPNSTASDDIDREWLSDNVFMRVELMYLIASEASYFLQKQDSAQLFLTDLISNRIDTTAAATAAYTTFAATLSTPSVFVQELIRNWRLELWGEGYGLQTFRRLTSHAYRWYNESTDTEEEKVRRGSNHLYNAGKEMDYSDETIFTLQIPASETNYNPNM